MSKQAICCFNFQKHCPILFRCTCLMHLHTSINYPQWKVTLTVTYRKMTRLHYHSPKQILLYISCIFLTTMVLEYVCIRLAGYKGSEPGAEWIIQLRIGPLFIISAHTAWHNELNIIGCWNSICLSISYGIHWFYTIVFRQQEL